MSSTPLLIQQNKSERGKGKETNIPQSLLPIPPQLRPRRLRRPLRIIINTLRPALLSSRRIAMERLVREDLHLGLRFRGSFGFAFLRAFRGGRGGGGRGRGGFFGKAGSGDAHYHPCEMAPCSHEQCPFPTSLASILHLTQLSYIRAPSPLSTFLFFLTIYHTSRKKSRINPNLRIRHQRRVRLEPCYRRFGDCRLVGEVL